MGSVVMVPTTIMLCYVIAADTDNSRLGTALKQCACAFRDLSFVSRVSRGPRCPAKGVPVTIVVGPSMPC